MDSSTQDVLQLIQAHQEKAARLPPAEEIKTLLAYSVRGLLFTFSENGDYLSSSTVEFACDDDGSPILEVNSTDYAKDLLANPKCSLRIVRDPNDETDLEITLHGHVVPVSNKDRDAIQNAYLARHPKESSVDSDDFQYLRIEPRAVAYKSGLAMGLLGSGELSKEEYKAAKVDPIAQFSKPITSHMNRDHADDTKLIVQHSTSISVDSAYMLDTDSLGFNVMAVYRGTNYKLRIPFPRPAKERKDVKTLVIEMLEAAKAQINKS